MARGSRPRSTEGMPAGYERDEQEQINADALAEEAETRRAGIEGGRIDPKVFEPDREIISHFNELDVSNADPAYKYCWVCTAARGVMVTAKLAIRVRNMATGHMEPTWEVVTGAMREAEECKDATGVRRIGDTILMRCRKDHFALIQKFENEKRLHQQGANESTLLEMAEQQNRRGRGVVVHVNSPLADPQLRDAARRAAARGIARKQFEGMIRAGTVPGMEIRR